MIMILSRYMPATVGQGIKPLVHILVEVFVLGMVGLYMAGCQSTPSTSTDLQACLTKNGVRYYSVSQLENGQFHIVLHEDASNLDCLRGQNLRYLDISYTHISSLAPLTNCLLETICLESNLVTDLTPLTYTGVKEVWLSPVKVSGSMDCLRTIPTLQHINCLPTNAFWAAWDSGNHNPGMQCGPHTSPAWKRMLDQHEKHQQAEPTDAAAASRGQ